MPAVSIHNKHNIANSLCSCW